MHEPIRRLRGSLWDSSEPSPARPWPDNRWYISGIPRGQGTGRASTPSPDAPASSLSALSNYYGPIRLPNMLWPLLKSHEGRKPTLDNRGNLGSTRAGRLLWHAFLSNQRTQGKMA